MIAAKGAFPVMESETQDRLSLLKQKIHDEDYLFEAVQRIAQVLSNEITGSSGKAVHKYTPHVSQSRRIYRRKGR